MLPEWVSDAPGGADLRIRLTPRAAKDTVAGARGGRLTVRVRAIPEKGKANEAACTLLAAALGRPKRSVVVVAGSKAREKTLHVEGLSAREVADALQA